jgi:hypothetical protein
MDGRYIEGIAGGVEGFDQFPNLTLWKWFRWMLKRIKVVRPLWYCDLSREKMKRVLETVGWERYGQHHGENVFTEWYGYYYRPRFLGWHGGMYSLSANVRSGFMSRRDALHAYKNPSVSSFTLTKVAEEVGRPTTFIKDHTHFKTYRWHFKFLKPVFYILYKLKYIPRTFYEKYC